MAENKTKIKENDDNGAHGGSKRRSSAEINHWAFLEEIEAPMWADLTLEPKLMAEDNMDAWFYTSHLFHQLSARQLRSAFSHPDVGNDFINFTLERACSPKLPSSVSKSRGNDYIGGQRRRIAGVSVIESHPVNDLGRNSRSDTRLSHECKPTEPFVTKSDASSSITSVLCKNRNAATVSSNSQVMLNDTGMCDALKTQSDFRSDVSTSTITTLCQQQCLKCLEVPKEAFGQPGGLLNSLKANYRRSYATRPASRIAVHDRGQEGRKSSASKTSVGSSSVGFDGTCKRSPVFANHDNSNQVKANMKVYIKPTASSADISDDSVDKDYKPSSGKTSVGSCSIGCDGTGNRSPELAKNDDLNQVKVDMNVNVKATRSSTDISVDSVDKDHKSSAGKSSLGSSSAGCEIIGKRSSVLSKTDNWNQVNRHMNVNIEPPASGTNICDDTKEKNRKSSAGKSSLGSSSDGLHREGKKSTMLPETYHRTQVRADINIDRKPKGPKPPTQKYNAGISIPRLETRKLAAGPCQVKDRNSSFRGSEKLAQPLKVRGSANSRSEVSVKNTEAGLKQNRPGNSKLLSKSVPTIRGGAIDQQLVELSANVWSVRSSRVLRRDAAVAATCLKALKSEVPGGALKVKDKVERSRCNVSGCSDKEKKREVTSSQKSDAKYNVPVVRVSEPKIPKLKSENKSKAALVRPMVKTGGVDKCKLRSDTRVYLR